MGAEKYVFFNGAGISISAGLPDFRSSNGIFKLKLGDKTTSYDLFDASQCLQNHDRYLNWLQGMGKLYDMISEVKPTSFHHFLTRLNKQGKLLRVYTQNIDELEFKAGLKKDKVVLLHGTIHNVFCVQCQHIQRTKTCIDTFNKGEVQACTKCVKVAEERKTKGLRERSVGTLRPQVVLYNEPHPEGDYIAKMLKKDRKKQHIIVIIGTSLKVHGFKQAIKDISIGNQVWLVNPDENLVVPSDLKSVITKTLHMTADEFVTHMDTHVLKQTTMDYFVIKTPKKKENLDNITKAQIEKAVDTDPENKPKIKSKVLGPFIVKKSK